MNLRRHSTSHLKVHMRFYFKKHKKIAKKCQEKDAFDVAVDGSLDDAIKGTPLNLFTRPLYLIKSRTNRIADILKSDSEADVHRCLRSLTEKGLFKSIFLTKVADRKPKKRLHQRCFPVSLPNITELFFAKHVWVVTASAKYHSFSLLHRPHQQNVTLDLGYILIIFKYFQSKHCESLVNSCFWKS